MDTIKVINNITETLKDDLQNTIHKNSRVSVAAACFSMYAFNELKKQLSSIDEFRFIFTSPTFITEKAEKQKREFYIPRLSREQSLYGTEFEIKLRNEMTQKAIAQECADWIRHKARFKSNTTGENMSGFMTVASASGVAAYMPINGFTTVDIGCERGNNSYNMVNRMEAPFSAQYMQLFDSLWNDRTKIQDVTDVIIDNITSAYNENSPEFIYFMMLYNVFSEFLDDLSEDVLPNEATGFKQSRIWGMLYDFQKDAVLAIINKLEKYNGCILADSVGLGKTFTALAVIKYYENRNKTVKRPAAFSIDGRKYPAETWKELFARVCEVLYSRDPEILKGMVDEKRQVGRRRVRMTYDKKTILRPVKIKGSSIWLETNRSASDIMKSILTLAERYGIPKEKIRVYFKRDYTGLHKEDITEI